MRRFWKNRMFFLLLGWGSLVLPMQGQPVFTDVTDAAGINHSFDVFQGIFGGGAAVLDYDQDGWEDIFISGGKGPNQLLKNKGDGTFENVSLSTGMDLLDGFVTQGAAVADVNKDGWPDLFVTTITFVFNNTFGEAPNVLLINNKNGTFSDQSLEYGIVEGTFSTGASFGDVNRDGYPDIYVCNYFSNYEGSLDEFEGPLVNGNTPPGADLLYINLGGERFVESSQAYGIERKGLTFQGMWTDIDNDFDLDLLVANDFGDRELPNLIYRNEYPKASFTEIGEEMNFDFGINGMGIASTDINQDGYLDYLVSNIQVSPLFISQGPGKPYVEQSFARGIGYSTVSTNDGNRVVPVSWGINFFDMDHDQDEDLYISNGCLNPSLVPNPNLFLENTGALFREFGFESQTNDHSIGRGSVVFDYDKDGDLDVLVVNQNPYRDDNPGIEFRSTRLYRNDLNNDNNWLQLKLEGNKSETHGIGARIEVFVEGNMLLKEIYGGSSHESQNTTLAHFGLGTATQADSINIYWTASGLQKLENVQANQVLAVKEDGAGFVNQGELEEILFYPIPFSREIFLDVPLSMTRKPGLVRVVDMRGKEMYRRLFPSLQAVGNQMEVRHNLAPGIYILWLKADGRDFQTKVLVE